MIQTRIYLVTNGDTRRLIEAGSAAQAIRHCVRNTYSAKAATPKEIANFMGAGYPVEHVSGDIDEKRIPAAMQQTQASQ